MNVLLFGRTAFGEVLPLEETIHDAAGLHQVGAAAEQARRSRRRCDSVEIGPRRGDERGAAVRQRKNQVQCTLALHSAQYPKRLSFQRMARAHDPHPLRQVLDVSSLSCSSLTP